MSDTFECELCHGVFDKETSDAEQDAEALELFGVENASQRLDDDMAIVCHDCWIKMGCDKIAKAN